MTQLTIEGLTKVFNSGDNEIVAVDNLDLSIEEGEFLVLVGPSGCGKSTTLRTIAGLETLSDGDIRIEEDSVTGHKPMNRNIAMVFQNYALYPHMTARENMSFGLKMATDLSRNEIDRRVERTAEMMGISDLLAKRPGELSGGQQQRVALGRAIVREPAVFLMDEPLSNLDAKLRTSMRTELQDLQQDLNVTTIYVTHDQTEAMTMGDRIAILNDGELQQVGTPLECYYQPVNMFVASFIGSPSMNFFDVRATDADGKRVFEHEQFSYPISTETAETLGGSTDEFTIGIRPEDIEIADEEGPQTIRTPIKVIEPLGDVSHLYVELGGETLTVNAETIRTVELEDEVILKIPEDSIHIFDIESGDVVKNSEMNLSDKMSVQSVALNHQTTS
jgi:multiple sugar transport system ATP-binding protein